MELNQKELHRLQGNLREIINACTAGRKFCCDTSQLDARDTIGKGMGYLILAESELGQLSFRDPSGAQITTAEGGGGGGSK